MPTRPTGPNGHPRPRRAQAGWPPPGAAAARWSAGGWRMWSGGPRLSRGWTPSPHPSNRTVPRVAALPPTDHPNQSHRMVHMAVALADRCRASGVGGPAGCGRGRAGSAQERCNDCQGHRRRPGRGDRTDGGRTPHTMPSNTGFLLPDLSVDCPVTFWSPVHSVMPLLCSHAFNSLATNSRRLAGVYVPATRRAGRDCHPDGHGASPSACGKCGLSSTQTASITSGW